VLGQEVALPLQPWQLQQVLHQLSVLVPEGGQDYDVELWCERGEGEGKEEGTFQ
jgi:hypothetical protein